MATRASSTAEFVAFLRAADGVMPPERRLSLDPYARYFVQSAHYRAALATAPFARLLIRALDFNAPGVHAWILLRARYADEAVTQAVNAGIEQFVLLGAGYDSLVLSRDLGSAATVYEVDAPPTQRAKLATLERHALEPRTTVRYVPCDFETTSARDALATSDFDPTRPCLVVWLGVSCYLTAPAFERAVADVGAISAPASRLVWDYIDRSVVDGTTDLRGAKVAARHVEARNEPYLLGFQPQGLSPAMEAGGFEVVDHARVPEMIDRLAPPGGAWCRPGDFVGVVTAERTAA